MAQFTKAIHKVLRHEGVVFGPDALPVAGKTGYVNHPDDPGGETNYGITLATARGAGYGGPMREIPYSVVLSIYRMLYWDRIHGDEIPDQEIAEEMFDTAVNCGVGTVAKFLQRTLNVLNDKGMRYADLAVDGSIGPTTLGTLEKALSLASWYRLCILRALDSLQCVRYIEIAERNPKFEVFMAGWLRNRVGLPGASEPG
jgi:lysozyme family protein